SGDRVLAVDGRETPTWMELQMALLPAALDRVDVPLRVAGEAGGGERQVVLRLSALPAGFDQRQVLRSIGLLPRHMTVPADIGRVVPEGAAWGTLAEGDRITAIDGHRVESFADIAPPVQALGRRGGDAMVDVTRDGARLPSPPQPRALTHAGGRPPRWCRRWAGAAARPWSKSPATASAWRSRCSRERSPTRAGARAGCWESKPPPASNCRPRTPCSATGRWRRCRPRPGRWDT